MIDRQPSFTIVNFKMRHKQLPSLEVYFWYHHQNLYKTFSDNNILKEEPCFCAWTRSPQKNALVLNTVKRTGKKVTQISKIKINNKPTTKENNTAHIYTPQKIDVLCRKWMKGETAGGSPGWCRKRSGCSKLAWACKETKLILLFSSHFSLSMRAWVKKE